MMEKKANALLAYVGERIRALLLAVAANESLFLFAAILPSLVLGSELFTWHQEAVNMFDRYIVVPWGMALCLVRLDRRNRMQIQEKRWDLRILFALLVWIVVPFGIRFGLTFNNATSWHGHCVVFFGLYAMLSEEAKEKRECLFDQACLLFGLLGLLVGGALLWCAWTGARIDSNWIAHYGTYAENGYSFGVFDGQHLCSGMHYNLTGVMMLCCTMFCFAGACRSKYRALRFAYVFTAVIAMLVVVLTQSRTARYSLIGAMGAGVFSYIVTLPMNRNAVIRWVAGALAACVVMVVSYVSASMLTDAALEHYAQLEQGRTVSVVAAACAEEEAKPAVQPKKARAAVDATLSARTDIWRNLFGYWKENPKELLIGAGMGRIGSRIVKGTIHEANGSVSVHNTYLQYLADYGIIGFSLMALFFLSILSKVLRVFFAAGEARIPGYCAMGMLVVAALMTGMMESWTLGAMTALNAAMFFALALLTARGRDMQK